MTKGAWLHYLERNLHFNSRNDSSADGISVLPEKCGEIVMRAGRTPERR